MGHAGFTVAYNRDRTDICYHWFGSMALDIVDNIICSFTDYGLVWKEVFQVNGLILFPVLLVGGGR